MDHPWGIQRKKKQKKREKKNKTKKKKKNLPSPGFDSNVRPIDYECNALPIELSHPT